MENKEVAAALRMYNATLTTLYGNPIDDGLFMMAASIIDDMTDKLETACHQLITIQKQLEQVKRERDDIARMEDDCPHCAHRNEHPADCDFNCLSCETPCICRECYNGSNFEWSGAEGGTAE